MTARSRRAPSLRTAVLAAVLVVTVVVGALIVRVGNDDDSHVRDIAPETASDGPAAPAHSTAQSGEATGVSAGFAGTEDGAVAAAVAYATASQQWLYLTDGEIEAAISEIATPVAAPRLADDLVRDISLTREQLAEASGRIWWLVRPLAWRVDDFADTEARVSVWTVTILSAAGVAAPQSEFLTVTLDLEWLDGDWRVDAVRDTPGPTPITGPHDQPWDAEPFDQALAGFTRIDGEPAS